MDPLRPRSNGRDSRSALNPAEPGYSVAPSPTSPAAVARCGTLADMSRGRGQDVDKLECFISVDVETGGATPADYALLSIGACLVDDPEATFYVELKPEDKRSTQEALAVSKLSLDVLEAMGEPPAEAMQHFADWVAEVVPATHRAVFVGFNAAFDWMFVADYFERYVGRNPFGYTALDIKAFAMGRLGSTWAETSMSVLGPKYLSGRPLAHHALSDAQDQAALFRALYAEPAHRREDEDPG
jgi:ribonuclease T